MADVVIYTIVLLLGICTVYPMYYVLIQSISDPAEVIKGNIYLLPKGFWLRCFPELFCENSKSLK